MGRIKSLKRAQAPMPTPKLEPICPLCERPIPPDEVDAHHFIPRSLGGKETLDLHRMCHRQIHALFTEMELARDYATPERLKSHPAMQRFILWVSKRPPGFRERVRRSAQKGINHSR